MTLYRNSALKTLVGLFILFAVCFYILPKRLVVETDSECKWPPPRPAIESAVVPFDITVCVRRADELISQSEPNYELSELFDIPQEHDVGPVEFDDLANLPDEIWKHMRYPEIFRTYPQNVPLKELVDEIKGGQKVSHVS